MIRVLTGLVLLADAVLLYRYDVPASGLGGRLVQGGLAALGAFAVFEGAVGWCAVRALGWRTRW